MAGFVIMHREALDHPLLQDGDRFRAWFWLIAKAAWKPTKFDVNGKIVTIERGQLCVSVRQLADAWGWSKSAVDRFLTRLKTETMIGTESGTGRLIITICNYEKYQDLSEEGGTESGTASGTAAGQQRDIKEQGNHITKEDTIVSSKSSSSESPDEIQQVFSAWCEVAKRCGLEVPRVLSAKRKTHLKARLKDTGFDPIIQSIEHIPKSSFLTGKVKDFRASFDWLLRPDSVNKILEGKYDDRPLHPRSSNGSRGDSGVEHLARRIEARRTAQSAEEAGRRDAGESGGAGEITLAPHAVDRSR